MSLRSEIREALASGPHTAAMVVEACAGIADEKQAAQNLYALQKEGKIKKVGTVGGRANYAIADWPEKASRENDAPPPKAGRKKKAAAKTKRARTAEVLAPAPTNGHAEEFAITDSGVLAIKQGALALQIHPESFARLRKFIERAESIFNPTE